MLSRNGSLSLLLLVAMTLGMASAQDCRANRLGASYTGNISTTTNGCTCRAWTNFTRYDDSMFPDGSKAAAGNRCRNPGVETDRPWCYIVASSCVGASEFDYCDGIPVCSKTCRETVPGTEYNGAISQSSTGAPCLSWTTQYTANFAPLFTADVTIPGRVCRNIAVDWTNPSSTNIVPWCLVNTTGNATLANCNIPFCSQVNPGGCRTDQLGTSYRGNQSTSVTGKTCIRWDSAPAVYTASTWPVSGETITAAANYCRNPNSSPVGLWCLVSANTWEPCVVPVCIPISGCPAPASDSYKYKDQITYSGCVSWSSVYTSRSSSWYNPNIVPPTSSAIISQPLFHPGVMPDLTLAAAADYCRNPDNDITGPWCPTSAGTKQYCANPCYLAPCMTDTRGLYYAGTVSVTRLNVPCQSWVSKFPVNHPYVTAGWFPDGSAEQAKNHCRTPDQNTWGPWCYKSNYNGTGSSWDYCNVPYCDGVTTVAPTASASTENCLRSTSGTEYSGTMSASASGKTCIAWTSNTALHTYYLPQMFNAASMTEARNYCRNPDASTTGPWCYVDATTRENCNVPMCSSITIVTAPGTVDPVTVIVTGILGMIGLTTTLALAGSLMAARTSLNAVQNSVVPQSASGQFSAALRPLPAFPAQPPDSFILGKTTKTIKTVSKTETIDTYDDLEQQDAPPPPQNPPPIGAGQETATVQQTTTTVTNQSYNQSSARMADARGGGSGGGGGGGGGLMVHQISTEPAAGSSVNTGGGFQVSRAQQQHVAFGRGDSGGGFSSHISTSGGARGASGYGNSYDQGNGMESSVVRISSHRNYAASGGGSYLDSSSAGHREAYLNGSRYTSGSGGGGSGGGYLNSSSAGHREAYGSRHTSSSGGGGGYLDPSSMGHREAYGSRYTSSSGGGGGYLDPSSMGHREAYGSRYTSGGGGGGSRYEVSVTTRGGGGGASRAVGASSSSSAVTTSQGMSSSGVVEMRERRSSIVDESLGSYLQAN